MTIHQIDTQSMVDIGARSADDVVILCHEVMSVGQALGKEKALPPAVARALERLGISHADLVAANSAPPPPKPSPGTTGFDVQLDLGRYWSGLYSNLDSYLVLPGPLSGAAQVVLDRLFPTGVAWVRRAQKGLWGQSEKRTLWLKEEKVAGALAELPSAAPFVAAILKAHRALGVEAGITREKAAAAGGPTLGVAIDHARGVLKSVALQTAAWVDDQPAQAERGQRLLRPFEEWQSTAPAKTVVETPPAPPETKAAPATEPAAGTEATGAAGAAAVPEKK